MDLLSDILHQAGLQARLLDPRRLPAATALRFPCERSIGFHVVTQGRLWIHPTDGAEPLALSAGDVALMARGCLHVLATTPVLEGVAVQPLHGFVPDEGADTAARVVSGAYQFWNPPLHPLFSELPPWFVLRAAEMPRLGALALTVGLLGDEAGPAGHDTANLGSNTLLHGLLDVLLVLLLRDIVNRHGGSGWSQAVRDPAIRRAVALLQANPARPWTLEALAREAGLSRTVLAERFRSTMGQTPLAHLRTLRLQKAMQLLGDAQAAGRKLEDVAQSVGYQDAFGFSKAFKREVGLSPGEFRRRDLAERGSPWRFVAASGAGPHGGQGGD